MEYLLSFANRKLLWNYHPILRNAILLLENKTKIKEFELQKQNSTLQFTHLMKVFEYTEDPKPELINFFAVP